MVFHFLPRTATISLTLTYVHDALVHFYIFQFFIHRVLSSFHLLCYVYYIVLPVFLLHLTFLRLLSDCFGGSQKQLFLIVTSFYGLNLNFLLFKPNFICIIAWLSNRYLVDMHNICYC